MNQVVRDKVLCGLVDVLMSVRSTTQRSACNCSSGLRTHAGEILLKALIVEVDVTELVVRQRPLRHAGHLQQVRAGALTHVAQWEPAFLQNRNIDNWLSLN